MPVDLVAGDRLAAYRGRRAVPPLVVRSVSVTPGQRVCRILTTEGVVEADASLPVEVTD